MFIFTQWKFFNFFYFETEKNFTFVVTNSKHCYLTPLFRYLIVHMQLSSTNFIALMVQCDCMRAVLSALSLLIFHEISSQKKIFHEISCLAGSSWMPLLWRNLTFKSPFIIVTIKLLKLSSHIFMVIDWINWSN